MITEKRINQISKILKYEELITDNYDITWLEKYIKLLSNRTKSLFDLIGKYFTSNQTTNYIINNIYSINDIFTSVPTDLDLFLAEIKSEKFKYIFYDCIEILNLYLDKLVDIDINSHEIDRNIELIRLNQILRTESKFDIDIFTVYRIFSKLFNISTSIKEYQDETEKIILKFFNIFEKKLNKIPNNKNIYLNITFFNNFGKLFNTRYINFKNKNSVIKNCLSKKVLNSLFGKYKNLLLNSENFRKEISSYFIFSEEFIEKHINYFDLSKLNNNIGKIKLVKNSRINEENKKIDTFINYPISLDFYEKYKNQLTSFVTFATTYNKIDNICMVTSIIKNTDYNFQRYIYIFLDGNFLNDAILKYNIMGVCNLLFKEVKEINDKTNKNLVRQNIWEDLLSNIFLTNKSLLHCDTILKHFKWESFFKHRFIYKNVIEDIILDNINNLNYYELNQLSKNFIYSKKLLEKIIPRLNLQYLTESVYINENQLNIISKYLQCYLNRIEEKK